MTTYEFVVEEPPAAKVDSRLDHEQKRIAQAVKDAGGWVRFMRDDRLGPMRQKATRIRKGHDRTWASVGTFEVRGPERLPEGDYGLWARYVEG